MKKEVCGLISNICSILNAKNIKETDDVDDIIEYLKWINLKTEYLFKNTVIDVPKKWLQSKITEFQYDKLKTQLHVEDMSIIENYYINKTYNGKTEYILDNDKTPTNEERYKLANILTFQKKHVVWADFGYNIGCEFKGKHPALIMKNIGDNLIVIPLSSEDLDDTKDYIVKVKKDYVFRLPKIDRWANTHRLMPISIRRIDFTSPHGDVKKEVIKDILEAIKLAGVK
jgi:uncharacterized protein YifN (PemK superfamily)